MNDIVIIGAGPAGLTAAYELSKFETKTIILESDKQVGGISRTETYNEFRFDIGGHRFFSKVPYINRIWQDILGPDFVQCRRLSRIHYRGHFYDYPLRPINAVMGLGPVESLKIGVDYARAKIFPHKGETNFEQWVTNRFGARLYHIFFKTYTEKVWGLPCNEISSEWAAQRIKNLSLRQALYNALMANINGPEKEIITTLIDQFHYPKLGPGMMWERCSDILESKGHEIQLNEHVTCINHSDGKVSSVVTKNPNGQVQNLYGENYISSMPLRDLVRSMNPSPPQNVMDAANALRYRDYLTVVLIVEEEDVFPDNWIYIHTPEVKMGRIQNYKNWSSVMVPDPSKTALGLEYFLWETDEEWQWDNEHLIDLGIRESEQIGFVQRGDVVDGTVVRVKKAYPVYDRHYQESVKTIREYLATFSNLQTIGRNGLHRYNNQDHSMLTGIYAARNIEGGTFDVWSVNTEKDFHEQGTTTQPLESVHAGPSSKDDQLRDRISDEIEFLFHNIDPVALGISIASTGAMLLFLATAILIIKDGGTAGATLSLLNNFLPGYAIHWGGALIGSIVTAIYGFIVGALTASLWNRGMSFFRRRVEKKLQAQKRKQILEDV